jgi:exodeoxyribonuclease V gamma subunit
VEECEASSAESIRALVVLARSLLADVSVLKTQQLSLGKWCEFFAAVISTYFSEAPEESQEDAEARQRCYALIEELVSLDPDGETTMDGRVAVRFILDRLSRMTEGEDGYLVDGVSVSSFLPMRPVPFRVVFVAGLGEGKFPSSEVWSPLDVRAARRKASDVSPREQDKYMFLETILATREKLYVSWVGRNESSGEHIEPSGLVKELSQTLLELGLSAEALKSIEKKIPLRRHLDEQMLSLGTRHVALERQAANFGTYFSRFLADVAPGISSMEALSRPEDWRALDSQVCNQLFALCDIGNSENSVYKCSRKITEGVELVSVALLCRFLEDPALAEAQWRVGMRVEEYEELVEVTAETTEVDSLAAHNRSVEVIREAWRVSEENVDERELRLRSLHCSAYEKAGLKGAVPTGVMGDIVRDLELNMLVIASRALAGVVQFENSGVQRLPIFRSFFIGEHGEGERFASLDVSLPEKSIAIRAKIVDVILHGEQLVVPVFAMGEKAGWRDFVRGFLNVCVISASGVFLPSEFSVVVIPVRKNSAAQLADSQIMRFRTPTALLCLQWLKMLIDHWMSNSHSYYLPVGFLDKMQLRAKKSGSQFTTESFAQSQELTEFLWECWKEERVDPPEDAAASARRRLRRRLANPAAIEPPKEGIKLFKERFGFVLEHGFATAVQAEAGRGGE